MEKLGCCGWVRLSLRSVRLVLFTKTGHIKHYASSQATSRKPLLKPIRYGRFRTHHTHAACTAQTRSIDNVQTLAVKDLSHLLCFRCAAVFNQGTKRRNDFRASSSCRSPHPLSSGRRVRVRVSWQVPRADIRRAERSRKPPCRFCSPNHRICSLITLFCAPESPR